MKRRLFDWLSTVLERLLLLLDGKAPTRVRMKALTPAMIARYATRRKSREQARMSHHCNVPPWGSPGSSYCPLCRTERIYMPLATGMSSRPPYHHVLTYQGRRDGPGVVFQLINNRLCLADGTPVITGRRFKPAMTGRL